MSASLVLTVSTVNTHCYPFLKARVQSGELVSSSAQRLMFFILSLTENIPDTPACCFLMSSRRTTEGGPQREDHRDCDWLWHDQEAGGGAERDSMVP